MDFGVINHGYNIDCRLCIDTSSNKWFTLFTRCTISSFNQHNYFPASFSPIIIMSVLVCILAIINVKLLNCK